MLRDRNCWTSSSAMRSRYKEKSKNGLYREILRQLREAAKCSSTVVGWQHGLQVGGSDCRWVETKFKIKKIFCSQSHEMAMRLRVRGPCCPA